jgi:heat shock protein HslJ
MSESSGNATANGSGANSADRRTVAIVAAIAVVALVALAALAIAVSARESSDAESVDSDLVGQVWKWLEFNSPSGERIVVDDPNRYTIEFTSDGTVRVQADCNSGNGVYRIEGSNMDIQVQALTRAFCPPGSLSDQYIQWLNEVAIYRVEGDNLSMDLPADSGTLRFTASSVGEQAKVDPVLLGKTWKWYEFTSPSNKVVVGDPNQYAVVFQPDGLINVTADCNNGGGIYAAANGTINIEVNHMTMAACPPGSLGDPFVQGLNNVVVYRVDGDVLLMDLPADGGTLMLSENPPPPSATPTPPPQTDPRLVGVVWKWFEFESPDGEKILPSDPNQYTVEFMTDGTLRVKADCNSGNGRFSADGANIDIEVQAMTLAACPPGSYSDQFVTGLNSVTVYGFDGDVLLMDLPMDSGTIRFSESPPTTQPPQGDPNLVGTWNWTEFRSPSGETIVVPAPGQYTVEFTSNGTVNVKADCNNGNGAYTADGNNINIQVIAMTRALCPPGSFSDQYVAALNNATIYFFQNGNLFMDLPMDSGTMTFTRAQ